MVCRSTRKQTVIQASHYMLMAPGRRSSYRPSSHCHHPSIPSCLLYHCSLLDIHFILLLLAVLIQFALCL
ncbi:hypothetical protein K439DRAFT_406285 [Ramaria rubella]|nr:hypothetical protein K439DRAFT_406285 [Ramaria rubella]